MFSFGFPILKQGYINKSTYLSIFLAELYSEINFGIFPYIK